MAVAAEVLAAAECAVMEEDGPETVGIRELAATTVMAVAGCSADLAAMIHAATAAATTAVPAVDSADVVLAVAHQECLAVDRLTAEEVEADQAAAIEMAMAQTVNHPRKFENRNVTIGSSPERETPTIRSGFSTFCIVVRGCESIDAVRGLPIADRENLLMQLPQFDEFNGHAAGEVPIPSIRE